jgi:hypothetical protein
MGTWLASLFMTAQKGAVWPELGLAVAQFFGCRPDSSSPERHSRNDFFSDFRILYPGGLSIASGLPGVEVGAAATKRARRVVQPTRRIRSYVAPFFVTQPKDWPLKTAFGYILAWTNYGFTRLTQNLAGSSQALEPIFASSASPASDLI